MKKVLTIAGSDPSGGAGIQADIKTIAAHKMYAMSVICALTAQNTTGVYGVFETPREFVAQQLDCVFTDIYPDGVKIGMVSSAGIIRTIADKLEEYKAKNIVADPVMVSTAGGRLMRDGAASALIEYLLPLATVITPNIPEAEVLSGIEIKTKADMQRAVELIYSKIGASVLVKGGHLTGTADDLLYDGSSHEWICGERIDNSNTHGTGCTLSSAIACALADGATLYESVVSAKAYLTGALRAGLDLGAGSGPLDHMYGI